MDKTDAQVIQFSWVKKNWEWDVLIETSVFQLRDVCCFLLNILASWTVVTRNYVV
jgi:hypothetical protein